MSSSLTCDLFSKIKMVRYLIVWRTTRSLIKTSLCFGVELSHVLGTIIAGRLSSRGAGPWQKALLPLDAHLNRASASKKKRCDGAGLPESPWPVEAVVLVYPGKRAYGLGELFFWELKLFGDAADHGFFLETVLPAMEEAGSTSDERWGGPHKMWGGFDIHAVYAARAKCWEPVVTNGRLDLRYQATSSQWAQGFSFGSDVARVFTQMEWITPFDPGSRPAEDEPGPSGSEESHPEGRGFGLTSILDATLSRWCRVARGKRRAAVSLHSTLGAEGVSLFEHAVEVARQTPMLFQDLKPVVAGCPGRWAGRHVFSPIPKDLIPWLELASIIHLGKYAHFGCGTFILS